MSNELDVRRLLSFSQFYGLNPTLLDDYGAFDISLVSDLPLFIDPFLLFNSEKLEYKALHESIIRYVIFLRDKSITGGVNEGLLQNWYFFKEVKQNWLGFTEFGNGGHALGPEFADTLNKNLGRLFDPEQEDAITEGRHLEKVSLIRDGVGRDGISDFTTNLIKEYLLDYTQTFTLEHIKETDRRVFRVRKVRFNYETESWVEGTFTLPSLGDKADDFVILTPTDMLTCDDTWISRSDLIRGFWTIPEALRDAELRAQVENYLRQQLKHRPGKAPTQKERSAAAQATIDRFPEILDTYIALKEFDSDRAESVSTERVQRASQAFIHQLGLLVEDMKTHIGLPSGPPSSYTEALERVLAFKQYIENQDGYKLVNPEDRAFSTEKEVQLVFGLALIGSSFDVNREPNNGRGPVDYKLSKGAYDKSLIEFKLGSNTALKRNLEKQVEIYEKANRTKHSVKVIVNYTQQDEARVNRILQELNLNVDDHEEIVVIDARRDNKPTGSKA
jgi:hypothetical protein